ncbi:MAG: tRNA (adenine-N1)-methyltransferase [Candidatus Nanoarchaeia archaeon]|nr:tRNA (adenine-N1)-methyltransferase [Candidatus Nanoarchaeia archaeon]MDD5239617.1 tRNA (adenine-N1)-methyltransferase [Candidatus Nanoarchaeia archaeon]
MRMLIDEKGKKIFVQKNAKQDEIHSHLGMMSRKDVFKAKSGSYIKSHKNHKFLVVDPTIVDYFENLRRGPAIVLLKDAGIISAHTGISPGSFVVEAGSGSGALTCYLANLVRPLGHIVSYEREKKFMEIAKENVETFELGEYVTFKNKDAKTISEKEVDAVILDLAEPWHIVKKAEKALKTGGFFVSYLPTVNQLMVLNDALAKTKLKITKVVDVNMQEWKLGDATRPQSMQLAHTAFILFARKL